MSWNSLDELPGAVGATQTEITSDGLEDRRGNIEVELGTAGAAVRNSDDSGAAVLRDADAAAADVGRAVVEDRRDGSDCVAIAVVETAGAKARMEISEFARTGDSGAGDDGEHGREGDLVVEHGDWSKLVEDRVSGEVSVRCILV